MRTRLGRVVPLLVTVLLAGLVSGAVPDSASATRVQPAAPHRSGVHRKTFSRSVIDFNSKRLVNLNVCVHFNYSTTFHVTVAGTTGKKAPPAYNVWDFKNPRMTNPSLDVYFTRTCKFGSPKVKSSRLTAKTYVSASALTRNFCNFNPSVSVGLPWSISVGIAPTCDTTSAKRASRYRTLEPGRPHSRFNIGSSGTAATWKKTSDAFTFRKVDKYIQLCFRGRYYFDVQNAAGTKSDDVTISGSKSAMCLPVAYWAWLVTGRKY